MINLFLFKHSDCQLNDMFKDPGNVSEMGLIGWSIEFDNVGSYSPKRYTNVGKQCTPGAKWFGWSPGNATGVLRTTLKGFGYFTLDFGNCWYKGSVNVYLDDILIASAPVGVKRRAITHNFTSDSVLEIKDEGENSVVSLNSFSIYHLKGI